MVGWSFENYTPTLIAILLIGHNLVGFLMGTCFNSPILCGLWKHSKIYIAYRDKKPISLVQKCGHLSLLLIEGCKPSNSTLQLLGANFQLSEKARIYWNWNQLYETNYMVYKVWCWNITAQLHPSSFRVLKHGSQFLHVCFFRWGIG
jgi:hypothetical protein